MKGCVAMVVMAKLPECGAVKTRLSPALSPEERATLYRAFLLDRVDQILAIHGVLPCVAFTPPEARAAFASLLGPAVRLIPQRGADLGERLANAASALFEVGCRAVILVDSDTPTLPTSALERAVRALVEPANDTSPAGPEVVVGPARDGGNYLIGTRRPQPELFQGIEWSTPRVLPQTLVRAARAGLSVRLLPPWYDVDTPDDLSRLARDLESMGPAACGGPRRTAAAIAELSGGRPPCV